MSRTYRKIKDAGATKPGRPGDRHLHRGRMPKPGLLASGASVVPCAYCHGRSKTPGRALRKAGRCAIAEQMKEVEIPYVAETERGTGPYILHIAALEKL